MTIEVSDGSAADYLNLYIHVQDVFEVPENNAPFFQTDGILSILENESFVFEFNATDQDGDLLTYSILYGDDMQWFELNTITGTLGFLTPRDFENPEDNNTDNIYEVTIRVDDGNMSDTLFFL